MENHVFARSGIASLDDLKDPAARELFRQMELEQEGFLRHEGSFRSPSYKWPRAPLHTWSRCWEYPYAFWTIRQELHRLGMSAQPVLADIGSGVTFFPFAVAKLGCCVVCTDIDPVCGPDLDKARTLVSAVPGEVSFRLSTPERLPFRDGECDVAYCISVIEHIKDPEPTIAEIFRILKPGGLLCLTIDLDLRGPDIGPDGYAKLHSLLRGQFDLAVPERGIHPTRMLTSNAGPFPLPAQPEPTGLRAVARTLLKDYLGTSVEPAIPFLLTVEATVWRKPTAAA